MNESDPYLLKKIENFEIGSVFFFELEKVGEISKILMIFVKFTKGFTKGNIGKHKVFQFEFRRKKQPP